jgi:diaminopimelate epimerase
MELQFVKFNPSGNTTVLILDPLSRSQYPEIAVKVMSDTYLCAEQVGFLEKADDPGAAARLHMMGGGFCGNASRSFAAWIALGGLESGKLEGFREVEKQVRLQVSGHAGTLTARVYNQWSKHACNAEIDMPLPLKIRHGRNDQLSEYSIVVYEGIIHLILWNKVAAEVYVNIVEDFLEKQGFSTNCFGIMFFDSRTSEMIPLVRVKDVDSLVWESSSGSGTVALASALADKQQASIEHMQIRQPGGDLYVSVDWENEIKGVRLSGDIQITAIGTVYID